MQYEKPKALQYVDLKDLAKKKRETNVAQKIEHAKIKAMAMNAVHAEEA